MPRLPLPAVSSPCCCPPKNAHKKRRPQTQLPKQVCWWTPLPDISVWSTLPPLGWPTLRAESKPCASFHNPMIQWEKPIPEQFRARLKMHLHSALIKKCALALCDFSAASCASRTQKNLKGKMPTALRTGIAHQKEASHHDGAQPAAHRHGAKTSTPVFRGFAHSGLHIALY